MILLGLAALIVGATAAWLRGPTPAKSRYAVQVLARGERNSGDRNLVNPWGLAASSTGPWWLANEATETGTVYSGRGNRARLVVSVPGGPGRCRRQQHGRLRRTQRQGVGTRAADLRDRGRKAARLGTMGALAERLVTSDRDRLRRGPQGNDLPRRRTGGTARRAAALRDRLPQSEDRGRRFALAPRIAPGAFIDPNVSPWFGPSGILAADGRIFVSYVYRAPVNGNDAPKGGYIDAFSLDGRLLGRVASNGALNQPTALALAPKSFGSFGGDLLAANFGTGHIAAYEQRDNSSWRFHDLLRNADGKPLAINGLWGIAFGNDYAAGARDVLFYTAGPHRWRGATEIGVGGRFGSIALVS